jgi:exonuclease SbcD
MRILHTSDWHLGRSLYDRKRYDEFGSFLDWLAGFIQDHRIDILLVAGDIFDTTVPGNRAQELYYQFLNKVMNSCCRHVVIIGGNHDSPTFLDAPKDLLRALNVHVVGSVTENPEDEVIVLCNESLVAEAIVCAVPYLRDRDIRTVEAGESMDDKNRKLVEGITAHYQEIGKIALEKQKKVGDIPVIGMGHLFTSGGKTTDGDGVRELYVGSLAHVGENIFPDCFDYVALGHLHISQQIGKSNRIRYSGSPIPMGFGEAGQVKKVFVVDFTNRIPEITEHPIPCFQDLVRISGDADEILGRIAELKSQGSKAWLEISYSGPETFTGLNSLVDESIAGTGMESRGIKNKRMAERVLSRIDENETLDNLDVNDVFTRCLDAHGVEECDRPDLLAAYSETILLMQENDINAG